MMRLPRLLILLTLACCLSVGICVGTVLADDATPAAPPPDTGTAVAAPPTDATTTAAAPALNDLVDDYWHYGKIARYDLASDAGEKIVAADSGNPRVVLEAFEAIAGAKGDVIDKWMLRWKTLPVPTDPTEAAAAKRMRDVSTKLNDLINQGYETRRSDPDFIRNTINEMASGSCAYDNNLPRLAKSGELAVKVLIDILRNPDERQYHSVARRILRDLGRKALSPLLAATEMKDYDTLVDVIAALGDIGYSVATPYLSNLATGSEFPSSVHTAAHNALNHMGAPNPNSPARRPVLRRGRKALLQPLRHRALRRQDGFHLVLEPAARTDQAGCAHADLRRLHGHARVRICPQAGPGEGRSGGPVARIEYQARSGGHAHRR